MLNTKKIINFSMPKRKPKKQNPPPESAKEEEKNQGPNLHAEIKNDFSNDNHKENLNQEEEDFWVDCKKYNF